MTVQGASLSDLPNRIDCLQYVLNGLANLHTTADPPLQISFSFQTSRPADLNPSSWTDVSGWGSYTATEKDAVRAALHEYEKYINVQFVETNTELAYDLTFLRASQGVSGGRGRFQYNYPPFEYDGFAVYNTNRDLTDPANFSLILHEIGHTLSLKHPGNYDVNPANAPPGPYLPTAEDNYKFTVMSYYDNPELALSPLNLMLYDIAALQERWGANMTYNSGDTTYAPRADGNLFVIWDGGGTDAIDGSAYLNSTIDLRQGRFSNFNGEDRVGVAYHADIENALGGSGNDRLFGNGLANALDGAGGQDTLRGLGGNDTLTGGPGSDTLDGGRGIDTADYSGSGAGVNVSLATGSTTGGDAAHDSLISIENVTGTGFRDVLVGNGARNVLSGAAMSDSLYGGGGSDRLNGGGGNDHLYGGNGNDVLLGGVGHDGMAGNGGSDTLMGGGASDTLSGFSGRDVLLGGAGGDHLAGNSGADHLNGGRGTDTLLGGAGKDILRGGAGSDAFQFDRVSDSKPGAQHDRITDFVHGVDHIDLALIDAVSGGGDDSFSFIATSDFSGAAGELRYVSGGGHTIIEGNVNNDQTADFRIELTSEVSLGSGDFVL